jgi:hypothetical protein
MDDNHNNNKKSDNAIKYLHSKNVKKFTPAISFIDDDIIKNKKGFNLIKEEENKEQLDNN